MSSSLRSLVPIVATALFASACSSVERRHSIGDDLPIVDVFARVHGSVVTLHTIETGPSLSAGGQVSSETGVGSGTLISAEGEILTAAHVVQTVDAVVVEFFDGTSVTGRVVSSDPVSDLALVKLDGPVPRGIKPAPLGDTQRVRVGQRVFVIGAPLGVSHTLTVGVLSAHRRVPTFAGNEGIMIEVFQTDAAVNPGNSGGPLFDMSGHVIGVVSYIISKSGGSEGLGFAVTSKTVRERLLNRSPMWTGITFVPLQGRLAEILNLPKGSGGWLVQRVVANSPGDRLGLRGGDVPAKIAEQALLLGGDVLLEVHGQSLSDPKQLEALRARLRALGPEDELHVTVLRAGERVTLKRRCGDLAIGSE